VIMERFHDQPLSKTGTFNVNCLVLIESKSVKEQKE